LHAESLGPHAWKHVAYLLQSAICVQATYWLLHGPMTAHPKQSDWPLHAPGASAHEPPPLDEEVGGTDPELDAAPNPLWVLEAAPNPLPVVGAPPNPLPLLGAPPNPLAVLVAFPPHEAGGGTQLFVVLSHHSPFPQPFVWHPAPAHWVHCAETFGPTSDPHTCPPLDVEAACPGPGPTEMLSSPPPPPTPC
jgi:hypothetical protein